MSKVQHLLLEEVALLRIQIGVGPSDPLKHLLQGTKLLLECMTECNKIIRLHHASFIMTARLDGFNQQLKFAGTFQRPKALLCTTTSGECYLLLDD
jgi:hypothetical protein